jgi:hypothetical protein
MQAFRVVNRTFASFPSESYKQEKERGASKKDEEISDNESLRVKKLFGVRQNARASGNLGPFLRMI